MKKIIALVCIVCLVMSLGLAACGNTTASTAAPSGSSGGSAAPASSGTASTSEVTDVIGAGVAFHNTVKTDETLVVALGQEPAHLISRMGAGMTAAYIRLMIGDGLVRYDYETQEVKPGLLTEWEWVDETHIHAKVRQGVIACDGTEFNAHDVIFSLEKGAELAPNYMAKFFNVPNCVVEDDYTIMFELSSPNYTVMNELTNAVCLFYDQSSYEAAGGDEGAAVNPLWGTGKYRFVEWVPGQYVLLERNENYWDEEYVGYYKFIKFTFVPDSATRMMAVQSGDADVAMDVPLVQAAVLVGSGNCDVYNLVNNNNYGFEVNCSPDRVLGTDIRLREAIRYAIDANALNQIITAGYGNLEPFWLILDSRFGYDPTNGAGVEYNPDKARELLKEAGYENGLEISTLCDTKNEEILTAVQAMLAEVGIKVNLVMADQTVLFDMAKNGEFDINYQGHQALCFYRTNTFQCLNPRLIKAGSVNGGPRILDDELQALIDEVIATQDDARTEELCKEIEQYVWDNVGYIGISSGIYTVLAKPNMTGFALPSDGGICDVSYVTPLQ